MQSQVYGKVKKIGELESVAFNQLKGPWKKISHQFQVELLPLMGGRLMFLWEFCASKNVSVDLHGFQEHRRDLTSSDDFDQGGPWVSTRVWDLW